MDSALFSLPVASSALVWRNTPLLPAIASVERPIALALSCANPTLIGISLWFALAFGTARLSGQRMSHTIAQAWNNVPPAGREAT